METSLSERKPGPEEPGGEGPSSRRSRATMRDVAALAGVSLKTVSRVINGATNVAPDLADKVNRAAEQLRYRPDFTASSLRRSDRQSRLIGVLVEDVANPFSAILQRTIEEVAMARGFVVLAASLSSSAARERTIAGIMAQHRVDGIIMAPASTNQSYLAMEQEHGTPIVFVDRPPSYLAADSIGSDNRAGAVLGTQHLMTQGHRRIGFLGAAQSIVTSANRYAGYLDALQQAGLEPDESIIGLDLTTSAQAHAYIEARADAPGAPTAWFTSQNLLTIGALTALRGLGLRTSVAHLGFDDVPLAEVLDPGLSVVAQDVTGMAERAANLLLDRIMGDSEPFVSEQLPTKLLVRGSAEIPGPSPS